MHRPGNAGLFGCYRVGELAQRALGLGARKQITRQTAGTLVPGCGIRIGQHLAQLFLGSRSGGGIHDGGFADEGARREIRRDAVPGRGAIGGDAQELSRCRVELAGVELRRRDLIGAVLLHPGRGRGRQSGRNDWPRRIGTIREDLILRDYPGPQIVMRSARAPAFDQVRGGVAECVVAAIQNRDVAGQDLEVADWRGIGWIERRRAHLEARFQPPLDRRRILAVPEIIRPGGLRQQSLLVRAAETDTGEIAVSRHQIDAPILRLQDVKLATEKSRLIERLGLTGEHSLGQERTATRKIFRSDQRPGHDQCDGQNQNALCHWLTFRSIACKWSGDHARGSNT